MTTSGGARPWVREHLERYLQTAGEDGHIWRSVPTLLLTTTGRKSSEPYTTPLIYGEDAGRYVVVASRGGAPSHPQWYLNLDAKLVRRRADGRHLPALRRVSGGHGARDSRRHSGARWLNRRLCAVQPLADELKSSRAWRPGCSFAC